MVRYFPRGRGTLGTPFHIKWAPENRREKSDAPSPEQIKFQELLRELFQFECADLDFGIYRIMNHKRKVIDRYIDQELPAAIEEAVGKGAIATESERARVLEETREQMLEYFGEDTIAPDGRLLKYDETPLGKKYMLWHARARNSQSAGGVRRDIYNHLYSFFSRYYQDGDFIPKRRYSWEHPYVVPYNGEEVHFHWANRDQYYVKAAEQFRDYVYRTGSGVSVRFVLRSADVKQNDVKGQKRCFFPVLSEVRWSDERRALELPFEYRPLTRDESKEFGRNGQQETILEQAEAAIAESLAGMPHAIKALLDPRQGGDGEEASYFAYHALRFTRRRTSDFFIHRHLERFLSRELEFYLKSEVLKLSPFGAGSEERADAWLDKIRIIRDVGRNIVAFLAQIEGFQKMLWEKRKFVVDPQYCIAVGLIPDELVPGVLECAAQWQEWRDLGFISGDGVLLSSSGDHSARQDFLTAHPGLLVDTRHFGSEFIDQLLGALQDIDDMTDGVAIKSENWQALNLLRERYHDRLSCVFIDPPYNTGDSEILYKNGYLLSSWLSLMANRIEMVEHMLAADAALFVAIDDFELRDLCALVDTILPEWRRELIVVNHHPQGGKGKALSTTHEYLVTCIAGNCVLRGRADSVERRPFKRSGTAESNFRSGRPNSFYAILVDANSLSVEGIERPPPAGYGSYPVGPTTEGYKRVYPIGLDGSERVWRRSFKSCRRLVNNGKLIVTENMTVYQTIQPQERSAAIFSNWIDKRHNAGEWGANLLTDIMGHRNMFSYPKSVHTVTDAIGAATINLETIILDFFAGSGTTGHAVINLNREDGGQRKFILVEMGDHFDTVLLPRLKKVAFSPEWKKGKTKRPATGEEAQRGPRMIKYFHLEGYEDALNNIGFEREDELLFGIEDYMLSYMLQWGTKRSATLLNVAALVRPFDYKLRLNGNGQGVEMPVDLPETFNYLLGLAVRTRRVYYDGKRRYLVYAGSTREGRSAVVIWRNTADWTLEDRARDRDFVASNNLAEGADEIWMNGDSIVKGARQLDNLFKERMFASVNELGRGISAE